MPAPGPLSGTNGHDLSGTTAQRPTTCEPGETFFDTTIGQLMVWNGTNWTIAQGNISTLATAQSIATGNTILLPTGGTKKLTTAGAATGVILTAGTYDGQELTLFNNSANSITFAAVGTSNVANGTSAVIAANAGMTLVWSASDTKWYVV
jgi:hypothetical protein